MSTSSQQALTVKRKHKKAIVKAEPRHPVFPVGRDFLAIFPDARLAYLRAIEPDRSKGGRPKKVSG